MLILNAVGLQIRPSGQLSDLQKQFANATSKKEKKKLQTTIRRIREDAEKKRHGEEHSRGIKR